MEGKCEKVWNIFNYYPKEKSDIVALIQCDFFSEVLELHTTLQVILPEPKRNKERNKYPALYLLHGLSDNHTNWLRKTSLERYVNDLEIAVVIPSVDRSFYADMKYGHKYWTFLTEELPFVARSFFPLSDEREDNFVAGLSMGGYGAFKWALHYPERFAAAVSLSGVLDIVKWKEDIEKLVKHPMKRTAYLVFGDENIQGSENDLLFLLERISKTNQKLPLLFQYCGEQDSLYEHNINFMKKCQDTNTPLMTNFGKGDHGWSYWDETIQDVLKRLPIKRY